MDIMKKVVLSGGSGLIGTALASKLVTSGYEVVILTRNIRSQPRKPGIRYVEWNAKTSGKWESELEGADTVINLAGENIGGGLWTKNRKIRILNSRLAVGNALVSAIHKGSKKPELFIQVSAVGAYGISETMKMSENSPIGNDFLSGIAKQWEESTKAVESSGIKRATIRTGIVLDLKEGAFSMVLLPFKFYTGGRLGSGRQWFSWIHLKDEVNAIVFIIENKLEGVYNLTAPHPVRYSELVSVMSKVLRQPNWFPISGFFLHLLLGDMSSLVLDGQQVMNASSIT